MKSDTTYEAMSRGLAFDDGELRREAATAGGDCLSSKRRRICSRDSIEKTGRLDRSHMHCACTVAGKILRRTCVLCSMKGKPVRTSTYCTGCKEGTFSCITGDRNCFNYRKALCSSRQYLERVKSPPLASTQGGTGTMEIVREYKGSTRNEMTLDRSVSCTL